MSEARIGQAVYDIHGKYLGNVIRIEKEDNMLFYVPPDTPINYGRLRYFRDWKGEELST